MSAGRRAATAEVREIVECPGGRGGPCLGEHALRHLGARDLEVGLDSLSDLEVGIVARTAGVRLTTAALRSGGVAVLAPRVQRASGPQAHRLGVLCSKGPFLALAAEDIPEDDPVEAMRVLSGLRARCARQWTGPLVELAFALMAESCPTLAPALEAALAAAPGEGEGEGPPPGAPSLGDGEPVRPPHAPGPAEGVGAGGMHGGGDGPPPAGLAERAAALGGLVAPDLGPLDLVVLASVCAAAGEPAREGRALAAARELRRAGGGRVGAWYVEGVAVALLDPDTARAVRDEIDLTAPEGERAAPPSAARYASWVGRVFGLVERGEGAALSLLCCAGTRHVERLVAGAEAHTLAAPVLAAALLGDPRLARLLSRLAAPVEGWQELVSAVLASCAGMVEGADLDALLAGLDAMCTRWATDAYPSDERSASGLDAVAASVALARALRRRARNDFVGARHLLERTDVSLLGAPDRAILAVERALVEAGVAAPEHLEFPATVARRAALSGRLRPAAGFVRAARALMPADPTVLLLHALVVHCVDGGEAQSEFEAFRIAVGHAPVWRAQAAAVDYHLGLAQLRALEPGTDEAAVAVMTSAVAAGYRPSAEQLREAVEALEAHRSEALAGLLAPCLDTAIGIPEAMSALAEEAARGRRGALDLAASVAAHTGLSRALRFDMVEAALRGSETRGDAEGVEGLVDAASDVLARNQDADLDLRWERLLHASTPLRELLDPAHADLERLHILRRLGRPEEAGIIGRGLFFRAVAGELPDLSPAALHGLLEEVGGVDDAVAAVRTRLDARPCEDAPSRPVGVVFVGGDERQARLRDPVEAALAGRFEGLVEITWFFPGWSAGWADTAERVEAAYEGADALVLMPLVRTQLGRRLRRSCGEAGLPWVACTGHGRSAVELAIEHAVEVVERLRGGALNRAAPGASLPVTQRRASSAPFC